MKEQIQSGRGQPHSKALRAQVLVVRARDLERLGKEFFPHLGRHGRELVETLFGLKGYVLIVKP